MRLIGIASIVFVAALAYATSDLVPPTQAEPRAADGQAIFRFDTFGDEQLWTDVLRMQEAIATVDPGDGAGRRPEGRCRRLAARPLSRRSPPGTWISRILPSRSNCLRLNAVVGVKGHRQRHGPAHQGRDHVCAVPLVGRQLVRAGHRHSASTGGPTRT